MSLPKNLFTEASVIFNVFLLKFVYRKDSIRTYQEFI